MNKVRKALEFAIVAHRGQKDKAGNDYVFHPIAVSSMVNTEDERCTALLHDVMEDCGVTKEMLAKEFGDIIADAVDALTRKDGEDYFDYVKRAGGNPVARAVKIADLTHNTDLTRLPVVTERDIKRTEKYKRALEMLA